jgi:hypothetical protein
MKITYETFYELSRMLTGGMAIFHLIYSKHDDKDCFAWQQGVHDFARWLDENGFEITRKDEDFTY